MALDPKYNKRPEDSLFEDMVVTPLKEEQSAYYLKTAWLELFGTEPSLKSLAILWAQSALETAHWSLLRNNNWGNIKKRDGIKYTSYDCSEVVNGVNINYKPYHPETFFAAWDNPLDGAKGYLKFISEKTRYKAAWVKLQAGDPLGYVYALKAGGYFTAPVDKYYKTVMALYNTFMAKSTVLLAWAPPVPEEKPIVLTVPELTIDLASPEPPKVETPIDVFSSIINFLRILFNIKS